MGLADCKSAVVSLVLHA